MVFETSQDLRLIKLSLINRAFPFYYVYYYYCPSSPTFSQHPSSHILRSALFARFSPFAVGCLLLGVISIIRNDDLFTWILFHRTLINWIARDLWAVCIFVFLCEYKITTYNLLFFATFSSHYAVRRSIIIF